MSQKLNKRQTWLICLGLALAVLAAYAPLWGCWFVAFDDPSYVTDNDMVQHGLTLRSLTWAFTTGHAGNWHPLTWISHILDCQIYGVDHPAGHHFTSLLLHIANSILLFLLLARMTGAGWSAAMVAALFALHPLHVESVAWISERKDVLSTFFWMLTVWAYVTYTEPTETGGPRRKWFYFLALLFFALGLMAKQMLVTLPFVLMLLDFWPLRRVKFGRWLWLEKIPFLVLAFGASVVTFAVQKKGGAVASLDKLSLPQRLGNVPVSYLRYIGKTSWPESLSILYPFPRHPHILVDVAAGILLVLVTFWTARLSAVQPWLVVGWLWFLGTLVPVIGIVQVGSQALADRYSYIPVVGLFIMVVWSATAWHHIKPGRWPVLLAAPSLIVCIFLTSRQVGYWQSNQNLYRHAIAVTPDNYEAWDYLGDDYAANDHADKAVACFKESLRIAKDYSLALNGLGKLYFSQRRFDEALPLLELAARRYPENPQIHYNLGYVLLAKGLDADALAQFQEQVDLEPQTYSAQENFAEILLQHGLADDAQPHFQQAIEIRPDAAEPHYGLGRILLQKGLAAEAVAQFEMALKLRPDHFQSCLHLAWALATSPQPEVRQGARAVALALRAEKMSEGGNPQVLGILAAAYAEAGRYPEAVATAQRAARLALSVTNAVLAATLDKQLRLYEQGVPFRDVSGEAQKGGK